MKPRFLIFILIIVNTAYCNASEITITSWNIYFDDKSGEYRYPEILNSIVKGDSDIICLQEVTNNFIHKIKLDKRLLHYQLLGTSSDSRYQNIVLSKYPVKQHAVINIPTNMGRKAISVEAIVNNKVISVVNLHLDSMLDDTDIRIDQLKTIIEITKNQPDLILCGDMNFGVKDKENSYLIKKYSDAGQESKQPSYDVARNKLASQTKFVHEKSRRLDRILYRGGLELKSYQLNELPYSDHYPITAVFEQN